MSPAPLQSLADFAAQYPATGRRVVAFSGGLDSTVLLHAALRAGLAPRAIHINHGLHPAASAWQAHCESLCAHWEVPLRVLAVAVEVAGQGPEAAAREARYAAFAAELEAGDQLLLAHHRDDQVETLLLRALRGAGLEGLAGMPRRRPLGEAVLYRPLLDLPRSALESYARAHGLSWIEDGSNEDLRFDRNYLRREVLPRIAARWPGYRQTLARSADQLRQVAEAMPAAPLEDCTSVLGEPGFSTASLPAQRFARARAIRGWLATHGLAAPPAARLESFLDQLDGGRGAQLRGDGYLLERFRDAVFHRVELPPPATVPVAIKPGETVVIAGVGAVRLMGDPGMQSPAPELRWRSGGEGLLREDGTHQSLKNLFQECAVPPWWRARVPLLYSGDELLAAGPFRRAALPAAGALELHWEPAGELGR